ncbi:MAG: oxidoreductase [Myxococcota bacterium]
MTAVGSEQPRPRLAVYKFASCDGCQLQLLNLEDELLVLAERFDIVQFLEASSRVVEGPCDVALVEGSISTPSDAERIQAVRQQAGQLVTIGACATAGGIQHLRSRVDVEDWKRAVYPHPEWIETLATSTAISDHVHVDHEIQGCPVDKGEVLRVLLRGLLGTTPDPPRGSVCGECKRDGRVCVTVARGIPCLGPVTRAGCGALCPALGRGCYACFGPTEDPNTASLSNRFAELGVPRRDVARSFRGIQGQRPAFQRAAEALEDDDG